MVQYTPIKVVVENPDSSCMSSYSHFSNSRQVFCYSCDINADVTGELVEFLGRLNTIIENIPPLMYKIRHRRHKHSKHPR